MNDSSANASQTFKKKSSLPIWGIVFLWTIVICCIGYFGRGIGSKILPHAHEFVWSSQLQISPHTLVTIRAWRHGYGDFSQKRPLSDCQVALNGSHIMEMGPNVSLCHYTDQHGETIRGATPPDAQFIAGWLKDAGESAAESAADAPRIAARIAPLFDFDKLNSGLGPDWSTAYTETVPQLSYVMATIVLVLLWMAGLLTILCIASAMRRRQMESDPES